MERWSANLLVIYIIVVRLIMGCLMVRPGLEEIPTARGIFLLKHEPTVSQHVQQISIEVSSKISHSILEQSQNQESQITVKQGRIAILLNQSNPEVQEYALSQKIQKMLISANKVYKSTLIIQAPSYRLDDPAIIVQINRQLFKAFITALVDFSTKVDKRSLKYVYFKWQHSEVQELFLRNQTYFRAVRSMLVL